MPPPTEEELLSIAKKRVQARNGFIAHLMLFVVINAGLVVIWAFSGWGYPWFTWPLFMWGAAVLVHAVMLRIGPDSLGEERAVEREVQRLRLRTQPR